MTNKMIGSYSVINGEIEYIGNRIFKKSKLKNILSSLDFKNRISDINSNKEFWEKIVIIDSLLLDALNIFFRKEIGAVHQDIPMLTRAISSPGALGEKKIISDVNPFEIDFFNHRKKIFLSQSSQLYLEAMVLLTDLERVFNIGKSFRNEQSDYRHLTEFRQVEFEGIFNFEQIIQLQENLIKYLINYLVDNARKEILFFINEKDIENLLNTVNLPFLQIEFEEVFKILYKYTGQAEYNKKNFSILDFDAKAEILISQAMGKPNFLFVLHYPMKEVAFYHKVDETNTKAINCDLIFPNYGEVIGAGERIHSKSEYLAKKELFSLNGEDYDWYGELRNRQDIKINSGFGMGIERFLTALLKLPHIGLSVPFPRLSFELYP